VHLKHRQRAQITPLALYAMLVLVGAASLVVDAGVFFVTQRQLQTAVDAAALTAVWYTPVCSSFGTPPCTAIAPTLPPAPAGWPACTTTADCVADALLQENLGYTGALCRNLAPVPTGRTDRVNGLSYYIMTVDCDAPYWFARVFPEIPATVHLRAFARATIGYPTPTGVSPNNNSKPLASRLVS
jgi:hypothetical protein